MMANDEQGQQRERVIETRGWIPRVSLLRMSQQLRARVRDSSLLSSAADCELHGRNLA